VKAKLTRNAKNRKVSMEIQQVSHEEMAHNGKVSV